MPTLTILGHGTVDVPAGTRLVRAIQASGADILHRCGGWAKCTTCRVEITAGRPARITRAQHDRLVANGQLGDFDLACQCLVERDMTVRPLMTLAASGLDDAGPTPADGITPEPEWLPAPAVPDGWADGDGGDASTAPDVVPDDGSDGS